MYIQGVDSIYDLMWSKDVRYHELYHDIEVQFSTYNFEVADVAMIAKTFEDFELECQRLIGKDLVWPAYDYCMKNLTSVQSIGCPWSHKRGGTGRDILPEYAVSHANVPKPLLIEDRLWASLSCLEGGKGGPAKS